MDPYRVPASRPARPPPEPPALFSEEWWAAERAEADAERAVEARNQAAQVGKIVFVIEVVGGTLEALGALLSLMH